MTKVCLEEIILEIGLYENINDMPYIHFNKLISKHSILSAACKYNHSNKISIIIQHETIKQERRRYSNHGMNNAIHFRTNGIKSNEQNSKFTWNMQHEHNRYSKWTGVNHQYMESKQTITNSNSFT